MPVTHPVVLPLASVRVYGPAQGDAPVIDHGAKLYDIPALSFDPRAVSQSGGQPTLEFLQGVGIVNRPFIVLQDTRLANWTTSGGTWEERRGATGSPRKYRLEQLNATANAAEWSATSGFNLVADPHFAVSLAFFDSPPDHDATAKPPFVRVEFASVWALEFSKLYGSRVLRLVSGSWVYWGDLPEPVTVAGQDGDESLCVVRCYRGGFVVSTDFGKSYLYFGNADLSPVTLAAAPMVVRGQGGMVRFGLHQVQYLAGTYDPANRPTFVSRLSALPTITGRYLTPGTTAIAFTDTGDAFGGLIGYSATLTPRSISATPFSFYQGPELHAVRYRLPVVRGFTGGWNFTPFEDEILQVRISKPVDLAGAQATILVLKDAFEQFTGDWLTRKVEIRLGWLLDTGATQMYHVFTGYISKIGVEQRQWGTAVIPITVENVTIRAKTTEWTEFSCEPLGGYTANQALDICLDAIGLTAAHRLWHARGDAFVLAEGSPESPFLWPQPGDNVWETMVQIADLCQLEIGAFDNGTFVTVPLDYVEPFVSHTWAGAPADLLERAVQGASYSASLDGNVTCVICRGIDVFGNMLLAFGVDNPAELNPNSGRFREWRTTHREDVQGTCTMPMLLGLMQSRFMDLVPPRFDLDLESLVRLDVGRRQQVQIEGLTVGVADWDRFAVLALDINYERDPQRLKMTAGLLRL